MTILKFVKQFCYKISNYILIHLSKSACNIFLIQVQPAIDKMIGVQNKGGHIVVNGREVKVTRSVHGPAVTLDLKSGKHRAQLDIVASVDRTNVTGGKGNVDFVAKPSSSSVSEMI